MQLDWGSIPAYFGGIALLVTSGTLLQGRRVEIRKQANQIAAWVEKVDSQSPAPTVKGDVVVRLKNASDLPIVEVVVYMARTQGLSLRKDNSGAKVRMKPKYAMYGVGPDTTLDLDRVTDSPVIRVTGFSFVDARGRAWIRQDGRLRLRSGFVYRGKRWVLAQFRLLDEEIKAKTRQR